MIKLPDYFDSLVEQARARAEKAMTKFPQPNYVLNKVAEESGEVIKAVIHYTEGRETWVNVEAELIDNLAMLIRLVKEGDQVIGFTPPTEVQRLNATVQIDAIERESMKNLKWLFDLSLTCHALGIPLRLSDSQVEKIAEAFLELEQRLNATAQTVSDGWIFEACENEPCPNGAVVNVIGADIHLCSVCAGDKKYSRMKITALPKRLSLPTAAAPGGQDD